jgi:NAD(P)-dependent dehydrogenase (short-subunit alcohol dehydrogenase family)
MDPRLFSSKVYVVTGGANGIGLATTKQLLRYGAYVYILDINEGQSNELVTIYHDHVTYIYNDVRDRKNCHEVVQSIIARHGCIDGLVNNAAVCLLEGELPSDELFASVVDINIRGVWNMGVEVLEHMKKQGRGNVVNIGSVSSLCGVARIPVYTMSKHAVLGLTRTWALDFAKYGIRVNCVAPGTYLHMILIRSQIC